MPSGKSTLSIACCALLLAIAACKKENKNPQWDVEVLAPIFKVSLSAKNLLADSMLQVAPDGAVNLVYTINAYHPSVDSLFRLPDTLIATYQVAPIAIQLDPNTPFYNANNTVVMSIANGVQLKSAIIKKGFARFVGRNRLHTRVKYTFDIPLARLNNVPFHIDQEVAAAPTNGVAVSDNSFDI